MRQKSLLPSIFPFSPLLARLFVVLLWLLPWAGHAQILNVEKDRLSDDSTNIWVGSVDLTSNYRYQQVSVFDLKLVTNVAYLSALHNYMLISTVNLVRVGGTSVISDAYLHGRINFLRNEPLSYETFAQYQYDQSRGLRQRMLLGAGLRYEIIDEEKFSLALGPGLMGEQERWLPPNAENATVTQTDFLKSTNYVAGRWSPNDVLGFNAIVYYQARFNHFFQPRLSGDVNLTLQVTRVLAFSSRLAGQYDATPIVPIEKVNILFTNGIKLSF
ncbi:Protein of unknown function, DUF481 [Catalinimonas alkaloidigena]|uniref:DUF481 domain-containing protein n=1 Tax=Catalinimonas alkaloidigena TaxID=1075417 RepID=A0A1G9LKH5_9BACT|nr:DUF481 domain-containing protein [Catalinimonas alkaloidigena]SDL62440.1 Protein of unknown function, DUF481 [Catalinimonas alkaloidigena]